MCVVTTKTHRFTKTIEQAINSPYLIRILQWENVTLQRHYSVLLGTDILGDTILLRT